jgi:hydroxyacylglutathione hydrolase
VHVRGGDVVRLGDIKATVIDVPAHTAGHIAYHFVTEHAAFVGDTLFAMGCGRLFEGTAAQMYDNMRKLEALGDDTAIYCAHEYTLSNARFAVTVEPDNADLTRRFADVVAARERGEATVPTTIALERATNPFMRAASVEELAARRAAKDAA